MIAARRVVPPLASKANPSPGLTSTVSAKLLTVNADSSVRSSSRSTAAAHSRRRPRRRFRAAQPPETRFRTSFRHRERPLFSMDIVPGRSSRWIARLNESDGADSAKWIACSKPPRRTMRRFSRDLPDEFGSFQISPKMPLSRRAGCLRSNHRHRPLRAERDGDRELLSVIDVAGRATGNTRPARAPAGCVKNRSPRIA
jgi:hypothetical protein